MTDIDFSGVFPAMVTPFTEDNEIDTETLRADDVCHGCELSSATV